MLRLILLLLGVYFVFKLVIRPWLFNTTLRKSQNLGRGATNQNLPEVLIHCPVCGTYFQESRGAAVAGSVVCSVNCVEPYKESKGTK